jgi:hypothetical protein
MGRFQCALRPTPWCRLLEPIGRVPPVELGEMYYGGELPARAARLERMSLDGTWGSSFV